MTRVLLTARISNVDSVMFVNRIRKMVLCESFFKEFGVIASSVSPHLSLNEQ